METSHKIHVKLGDFEFSGEGSEDSVKEQFSQFIELVKSIHGTSNGLNRQDVKPKSHAKDENASIGNSRQLDVGAEPTTISRVFIQDTRVGISLRVLPKTEYRDPDTLILLLYGFGKIMSVHDVLGGALIDSAKQSGITIDRVDKVFPVSYADFYTKAGNRKGSRYGLTNRGIAKAEEILRTILD